MLSDGSFPIRPFFGTTKTRIRFRTETNARLLKA